MSNVNDSFFDGHYKDVWRAIIPSQLTEKEVGFMIDYFKLGPGDEVLDMMCGYGRHAIALSHKGINVTAVDNLSQYVKELNAESLKLQLPITVRQENVLNYKPDRKYKLIICMGNSLNFFDSNDLATILTNWAQAMDEGSHLLINSWSLAETVIPGFSENSEAAHIGIKIKSTSKYLFHPTRIETQTEMISDEGIKESKLAIDYIYSVNEIEHFLTNAGFVLDSIFSVPGKKLFSLGAPRAYIIARRTSVSS